MAVQDTAELRRELERIAAGSKPILVGPWLSEVGFELLYWIPFLQWFVEEHDVDRSRIVVVSRGGVKDWYHHVADRYVDLFQFYSASEFRDKNLERIAAAGKEKHESISAFDEDILSRLQPDHIPTEVDWLHPRFMYRIFSAYWRREQSTRLIEEMTRFRKLEVEPDLALRSTLPEDYVAVKFYFSKTLPGSAKNRQLVSDMLSALTESQDVVLLSTGLTLDEHDEHDEYGDAAVPRLHRIDQLLTPENNLAIQTQVIRGATSFIGTYGGFSYLAPFMGTPSVSFYAREWKFRPVHLEIARRACRVLKYGTFDGVKRGQDHVPTEGADLVALDVNQVELLRPLFGGRDEASGSPGESSGPPENPAGWQQAIARLRGR